MNNSIPQDEPQYNPSHTKRCAKCQLWLPFSAFGPHKQEKDGLYYCCRKCKNRIHRELRTSEKAWDGHLRQRYGITQKQYDKILLDQGNVCFACKLPETRIDVRTGKLKRFHVDHDHKTGDVRALLCNECNTALGSMQEDPERIQKLKEYAEWCGTREPNVKVVQLKLVD